MLIGNPIYVDADESCDGVEILFSFKRTLANLSGLTIQSSELQVLSGAECFTQTKPYTQGYVDGAQGATWWVRGKAPGIFVVRVKYTLSDGQCDFSDPVQFEVRDA